MAPPTIAVYVSGHGFGHATRSAEWIRAICSRNVRVKVVSSAPAFLFDEVLSHFSDIVELREAFLDVGVVQADAISIDAGETMSRLREFMASSLPKIEQETEWLKRNDIKLVLSDASFVPVAAARKAGVKSGFVTNFTWDSILEGYADPEGKDKPILAQVFEMCSSANYLLRMPGWIDVPAFPDPDRNESVFDTPVVVRKHRRPRDEVRAELGLDPKDKVVLISFGGHQLAKDSWEAGNFLPPGWVGLVCGPGKRIQTDGGSDGARLVSIPMESAYIPDITNASDVVLGKLGYGTCCECLDAKVPFVYVSRPGFIEEPGLLRLMLDCNPQGSVTEMPHADFREGNWASYLMEVVDKKHNPPRVPMDSNGDEWIADWVVSFLENGRPKPKTMS